jgi:hypothetical protein
MGDRLLMDKDSASFGDADALNPSGVQGIGFAQVIPANEMVTHIAPIRREGFPNDAVSPSGPARGRGAGGQEPGDPRLDAGSKGCEG